MRQLVQEHIVIPPLISLMLRKRKNLICGERFFSGLADRRGSIRTGCNVSRGLIESGSAG
jgi:hypothetical protein